MPESPNGQLISRKELMDILRVGLQAVSPYNSQPWEFKFNDGQLLIFPRQNERGFWKHKNTLYCALGAFLENLSQGARHYHYEAVLDPTLDPDINMTKPICRVTFRRRTESAEYPINHVLSRYTNRKKYHPKPVPPSVMLHIRKVYEGPTSSIIDLTGNRPFIENCALIERVRVANRLLRDEINTNLTHSAEETKKRRHGLDIRTLEMPLVAMLYLKLNRNRFFRHTIGASYIPQFFAGRINQRMLLETPLLIGFVQLEQQKLANLVNDWMNIQKLLNDLNKEGLSTHLVSSSVDLTKLRGFPWGRAEIDLISRAERNIRKTVGIEISTILTLVRIGYADECQIKSLRRDPEELFWNE